MESMNIPFRSSAILGKFGEANVSCVKVRSSWKVSICSPLIRWISIWKKKKLLSQETGKKGCINKKVLIISFNWNINWSFLDSHRRSSVFETNSSFLKKFCFYGTTWSIITFSFLVQNKQTPQPTNFSSASGKYSDLSSASACWWGGESDNELWESGAN